MRIRNNVISLNTYSYLDITGNRGQKPLEAESRICDVEMASVLLKKIKNRILQNPDQAVLAYANTVSEYILSLL